MNLLNFLIIGMSGIDNYAAGSGTAMDGLTLGAGSAVDGLGKEYFTQTTSGDTLSETPDTVSVQSTENFAESGTFKLFRNSDGEEIEVTYTGKTDTTFTGCTIASGTFVYVAGDRCYA